MLGGDLEALRGMCLVLWMRTQLICVMCALIQSSGSILAYYWQILLFLGLDYCKILVWSGAAAGQWSKLFGLQVISTASPKNHALVCALGADVYSTTAIRRLLRRSAHSQTASSRMQWTLVVGSLGNDGGRISLVLVEPVEVPGVKAQFFLVYTLLGKVFEHPMRFSPEGDDAATNTGFGTGIDLKESANSLDISNPQIMTG
ncbi:hypothetical protein GGX14DRAFT_405107 [Mycena pura]|uniref:Uncharacterized protein n=1 Tax=Mycena pura TaxID=153505 RepID=A0AAD6UT59_9AGAR|nr:hypothetical protein GGX14DRAFT_405107 [Mycena pura]